MPGCGVDCRIAGWGHIRYPMVSFTWYAYLSVIGMGRLLTRRIWQAPLLAMFAVTFTGTLLFSMFTYVLPDLV